MEKNNLTNYRNVYKSDHLGVVDVEELKERGEKLIFTISQVKQIKNAKVAGKNIDANIAYFKEPIKPMVLNAGNAKILRGFAGGTVFVENWNNITIELYIDEKASLAGKVVGGVRISPIKPKTQLPIFTEEMFKKAMENNATIENIKKHYLVTVEIEGKYKEYGTKK